MSRISKDNQDIENRFFMFCVRAAGRKFTIFKEKFIGVSKDEIKYEINKVLDHLPDKTLEELLAYLKELDSNKQSLSFDKATIDKILTEDKELLRKLAK